MELRAYRTRDCKALTDLFTETVHTVNAKDYSREQLDAWAGKAVDLAAWDRSFLAHRTLVAVERGMIVGFGDIDPTGYLDRLYVHKDHQRAGVATLLCDALEEGFPIVTTHASITARPFFEKRGYHVCKEQQVIRQGVALINFVMRKEQAK